MKFCMSPSPIGYVLSSDGDTDKNEAHTRIRTWVVSINDGFGRFIAHKGT